MEDSDHESQLSIAVGVHRAIEWCTNDHQMRSSVETGP